MDWGIDATQTFVDYGRYFVPDREVQIATIAGLIPTTTEPFMVLELSCGEGLLAEALLERLPACTVHAIDGSADMLRLARQRLATHGERFGAAQHDIAADDWRTAHGNLQAVVSSLAVHHLRGEQKQQLFRDVWRMLAPGGALVIADVIAPTTPLATAYAADAWDAAVRQRGQAIDGDADAAFGFFERERWNMYRHFDPDDIDHPSPLFDQLQWLAQAGFGAVDVYWMHAGHAIFGGQKGG